MLARTLLLVLLFSAVSQAKGAKSLEASIKQLIRQPQKYHGKTVAVTGYFECAFEAGCELRSGYVRQDKLKTILLDLTQKQAIALEKGKSLHGRLRVVGRFEYSKPTPNQLVSKADPHDSTSRAIIRVWQGFGFHACQITAITHIERI